MESYDYAQETIFKLDEHCSFETLKLQSENEYIVAGFRNAILYVQTNFRSVCGFNVIG